MPTVLVTVTVAPDATQAPPRYEFVIPSQPEPTPPAGQTATATPLGTTTPSPTRGQTGSVSIPSNTITTLQAAQPNVSTLAVVFDPAPTTGLPPREEIQGGGSVIPLAPPIDLKVELQDSEGNVVRPATTGDATQVTISLPVLPPPVEPNAKSAWLQALYDEDDLFLGYVLAPGEFDPNTNSFNINLPVEALQGTLFLPATIVPGYVQNHDPLVQTWSGPTQEAVNFGLAGPQWTTFPVVAPQIRLRLFVFNPVTQNYAWIDVAGVGPSGPPVEPRG